MLQTVGEVNEVTAFLGRRLQFLRHVGGLATNVMDMSDIQGETTNFHGASRKGDKSKDGTQKGGLAATTLARDAYKLTSAYVEVEAAKEVTVTKGEGGRAEGEHQLAAVNSSRKRTSFSEKRRRSLT